MTSQSSNKGKIVGTLLVRFIVPAWILTGAAFKLIERNPMLLPETLRDLADALFGAGEGDDKFAYLNLFMRTLIGLEFLSIGVMLFVRPLARAMATFMLACFCLILVGEMIRGQESCGCFGDAFTIKPWQMMIADGLLLVGVIFFKPIQPDTAKSAAKWPWAVAVMWAALGFGAAFGMPAKKAIEVQPVAPPTGKQGPNEVEPPVGHGSDESQVISKVPPSADACPAIPKPRKLQPNVWPMFDKWTGQSWDTIQLAQMVQDDIESWCEDELLIMLYRKDCDHCHELMNVFFTADPLPMRTVAIAVPYDNKSFAMEEELDMPCTACEQEQLHVGPSYAIQTPVLIKLKDGVVECAAEVNVEEDVLDCIPSVFFE